MRYTPLVNALPHCDFLLDCYGPGSTLRDVMEKAQAHADEAAADLRCVAAGINCNDAERALKTAMLLPYGRPLKVASSIARTARGSFAAGRLAFGEAGSAIKGITVIGRYPSYIEHAKTVGGSYFSLGKLGNMLPEDFVWYLNTKFLDRAVARGDEIVLSKPFDPVNDAKSWLADEIEYLHTRHGYVLKDGSRMVPGE